MNMFSKLLSSRGRLGVLGWIGSCGFAAVSVAEQTPAVRIQNDINNSDVVPLKGGRAQGGQAEFDAGRMPLNTKLNGISIVFKRSAEQQAALDELLAAQQDPKSAEYHRWLTPEEF